MFYCNFSNFNTNHCFNFDSNPTHLPAFFRFGLMNNSIPVHSGAIVQIYFGLYPSDCTPAFSFYTITVIEAGGIVHI